jgi:hypothetical protein
MLYFFNILILKIILKNKKNNFYIFLNKKYFKKQIPHFKTVKIL